MRKIQALLAATALVFAGTSSAAYRVKMRLVNILILSAILLGVSNSVQALAITTYTDRTTWETAVTSGLTNIDFNGLVSGSKNVTPSYSTGGVNFSVSGGSLSLVESLSSDASYLNSGYLEWQQSNPNTMTFTLPSANAFAFDYGQFRGNRSIFNIDVDGIVNSVSTELNAYSFFGAIADGNIGSIGIDVRANNFPIIDNFSFGTTAVPEPSIIALFAAGLFGLGFARRKVA